MPKSKRSDYCYVDKTYVEPNENPQRKERSRGAPFFKYRVSPIYKDSFGNYQIDRSSIRKKGSKWVEWVHRNLSENHCDECLNLDGCWFREDNKPKHPHHPFCHCVLEPIDFNEVMQKATAQSDYNKFNPYLFDPQNFYKHGKNIIFENWGYTIADAKWLQQEIEKQAKNKYIEGDYKIGVLNQYGQRISIRVEIYRKDTYEKVSFITGWLVLPNGKINLNTPYGGK